MNKKTILSLWLSILLAACSSVTPTIRPTAISSKASAVPTQTSYTSTQFPGKIQARTSEPSPGATPSSLPESGFTLERIAQSGGSIRGIKVVGDVAYVGMGPRLVAIDISQHDKPRLMRQSEPLPGIVTQVLQISSEPDPVLLVNAGKYLAMIVTSNQGELKPVQQLELSGAISALLWDAPSSILYAGGSIYQAPEKYTGFISAVGITPDNGLKLINSVGMPEQPLSLALGNGSLFAGAQGYEGGLYHVPLKVSGELSTPRLIIASTPERPLQPTSMQVIGEHLYLGYRDVEAYDITNPDQPVQIWPAVKIWPENLGSIVVRDFIVAGKQIYIFGWTIKSEYVREMVTITEPVVGSPSGEAASVTAMHKGGFLVAYNDLEIFETANPQAIQLVGTYQSPVTNATYAAADEGAVFVVDNGVGDGRSNAVLRVLRLPDLKQLGQVVTEIPNSWYGSGRWLQGIALDSDRVYLASMDSVWVYGVSSPEPNLLGKTGGFTGKLEAIAATRLGEKRLLATTQVTADSSIMLAVYDLTDPKKQITLSNPLTLDQGDALQIAWKGSALYVLLDTSYHSDRDRLYVIDFNDNALTLRDTLQLPTYTSAFAVDKDFITLISTEGLSIVSAGESQPLTLLAQAPLPEFGVGVASLNDKSLVAVGDEYGAAQLLAFEAQDTGKPREIGGIDIAVSNNNTVPILLTGNNIILANGSGGVEVLAYSH